MSAPALAPGPHVAATPLRSALRRLAHYAGRNRLYYSFWLLTVLGYAAGFIATPLLVGWCIEALVHGREPEEVARRVAALVLATLVRAALRFFSRTLAFNAAREIEYEIRNDLFAHLERLPQSFYSRWRTGDIMSRCVNDVNAVRMLLGVGLLNVAQTPLLYAGALSAMIWIDWQLALLVLLPYPAFIWIARSFGRAIHHWSLLTQEGLGELSNQLQETIAGIAVVKAYAMEGVTGARFGRVNDELYRRETSLVRANAAMPAITAMLPAMAMWIILLVGGSAILGGRMPVDQFFVFAMYVYELTFPTFIMGWVVALLQRGAASMQRIDALLSVVPSIADAPEAEAVAELRGELRFRGLSFAYPGREDRPALRDIELLVPAGTTLGIVGPVGSGKTTLASLIPRLLEVPPGRLFVDGIDVNRIPLATLRSNIAMVPQDSFLFSMSLADNIAFGVPEAEAREVAEAARRAQLEQDLAELPHGIETIVGERGVMLSGGQRQRTALARALALRPRILILDDTLSSVDAATQVAIQKELDRVFQGRTVIVVSHHVSAVRGADQVVVLDEGRIAERGTPLELLARGGLYARLAREEALEERLGAARVEAGA